MTRDRGMQRQRHWPRNQGRTVNRDLRIDFLRGLVLLWIVADHVHYNDAVWFITNEWLYFDGAAAFVFISGLVCGRVYWRIMQASGLWAAQRKALRRCLELYLAQLAVFLIVVGVAALARNWQPVPRDFYLDPLFADPSTALPRALALAYSPWLLDILKLYILMLLVLPGALWVYRRSRVAALAMSLSLYVMAHRYAWFTPIEYPSGLPWFWNPFAWQLLFFGAAAIGLENARGWRIPRHPALVFLAGCVMVGVVISVRQHWLGPRWTDRPTLGTAHLVSFAAFAYLLANLLSPSWRFWSRPVARPIVRCGQHSLEVFCCGVVISYLITLVFYWTTSPVFEAFIISCGIAASMFFATLAAICKNSAWALTRRDRLPAMAVPEAPTSPSPEQRLVLQHPALPGAASMAQQHLPVVGLTREGSSVPV
jgi:hypothetical protein